MNLANEGLEARKKDEEVATRKRKAEEDKQWEGKSLMLSQLPLFSDYVTSLENRDERVGSWRTFSNTKKKKKTKVAILG